MDCSCLSHTDHYNNQVQCCRCFLGFFCHFFTKLALWLQEKDAAVWGCFPRASELPELPCSQPQLQSPAWSCFQSWLFSSVCDITVMWALQFHGQWEAPWIKFPVWDCSILAPSSPAAEEGWCEWSWASALTISWWPLDHKPHPKSTYTLCTLFTAKAINEQFVRSGKYWKGSRAKEDTWNFGGGKNVLGNANSSK